MYISTIKVVVHVKTLVRPDLYVRGRERVCCFVKLNIRTPRQEVFLSGRMPLKVSCCDAFGCGVFNVSLSDCDCSLGFDLFENFSVLSVGISRRSGVEPFGNSSSEKSVGGSIGVSEYFSLMQILSA